MSGEHPSMTTKGSKREQNDFHKKNSLRAVFFAYLQVFFLLIIITIRFQILSINTFKCFPDDKL